MLYRVHSVWHLSIMLKKHTNATVSERKYFKKVIRYVWENYPKNTYDIACLGSVSVIGRTNRVNYKDIAIHFKKRSDAIAFRKIAKTL